MKTLAQQSGEHPTSYITSMQEYDEYLFSTYHFRINDLKKKPLKAYQIDVLRKLNPTEFELNSWREDGTFQHWLEWFSKIRKTPKNGQMNLFTPENS